MLTRLYKPFLVCVFLLVPLSLTAAPLTKLVVFGDSLSDNGNLASANGFGFLQSPPYHNGFTNGPNAVEKLATLLNAPLSPSYYFSGTVYGNNFAVAGARAAGNSVIDLNAQVFAFLSSQGNTAPDDTLYILFIGGNDIRDMRNQTNENASKTILDTASNNIRNALLQLHGAGANHFLVVNAPDIGKIPETQAFAAAGKSNLIKKASQKTAAFNNKLAGTVEYLKETGGADIVLFDLPTFLEGITDNNNSYNFSNTTDACFSSLTFSHYAPCDSSLMDSYFFFDEIHPTQRVHERVGRALFSVVPEAN